MSNPDETAARGTWSDPEFLANVTDLNPQRKHTQFADFHGHGWVFRAVFKKDRKGNLLDYRGPTSMPTIRATIAAAEPPMSSPHERREERRRTASSATACRST